MVGNCCLTAEKLFGLTRQTLSQNQFQICESDGSEEYRGNEALKFLSCYFSLLSK